jgi:hypothetical protein
MSGKKVAILQSNYIPWKGNFDLINMVDEYIILDDVQYTKRDWRNRNRIVTKDGIRWLTIPVRNSSFHQKIMDTEVVSREWTEKHWRLIELSYRHAPFFPELEASIKEMYGRACRERYLSRINLIFLEGICRLLGIHTDISWSADYFPEGCKSDRILDICIKTGAQIYLSGPAARDYLDVASFREAGISVKWMSYHGYPEYAQLHGLVFSHHVSILDLLFCCGVEGARKNMLSFT